MNAFGLDEPAVRAWFAQVIPAGDDLLFERGVGGRSNLTYVVSAADGGRWILRRPPVGHLAGRAHDVLREARILTGLHGSPVPVPAVVATCTDPTVTGAPFVVLEYVPGQVLRTPADVVRLTPQHQDALMSALMETLVALHHLAPDDVGLGDLGRRDDYVARQLRRWLTQSQAEQCAELPALTRAHDLLVAAIPPQRRSGIVHGDYRVENCIVDDQGAIRAVLDWEICTLGDPLADVGLLLAYWAEPGDEVTALEHSPTLAWPAGSRAAVRERYCRAAGIGPEDLTYYEAFGWWKLACIVGGVHARLGRGAIELADRDEPSYRAQAARLAQAALDRAHRL
jgi:aminoglycoside phosphotransferase (APT) family kinase protein